jgi:SseB protein C-terminal domain
LKVEQHRESAIHFVGEQDGPPERELKSELSQVLANAQTVQKAYLARVLYVSSKQASVALCLCDSEPSRNVVESCAQMFHKLFGPTQALDILFLKSTQQSEISEVCRPFFQR